MTIVRRVARSVQKLVKGVGEQTSRLVRDFVVGLVRGRSVVLSDIARSVDPRPRGFEATLERLSRGLASERVEVEEVIQRFVARAAKRSAHGFDVVAIDMGDIAKRYAKEMEHLCSVRDASESSRLGRTVLVSGYWTMDIALAAADHRTILLHRHAFSQNAPNFISPAVELRRALQLVCPHLAPNAVAMLDRGFDGKNYFEVLDEFFSRWVVRQQGVRHVWLPGARSRGTRVVEIAGALAKEHAAYPRCVDGNRHRLVRREVFYGFCVVHLDPPPRDEPDRRRAYTLIAVDFDPTGDRQPLMLLYSRPVRSVTEAGRLVEGYFRRWSVEETTRLSKQLSDLENFRVRSFVSIQHLIALAALVEGLIALLCAEAPALAARLADAAPVSGPVPPYPSYRVWLTVSIQMGGSVTRIA